LLLNDREHLPKIVTDIDGIRDILLALDPEIVLLREDISQLVKELYVNTTDKFITKWETDFSLPYDSSLTLEQRRQRIKNKLSRKKTLNWQNLRLLIKNNIVKPKFYIVNEAENYHFKIFLEEENNGELKRAITQAKPAYLTFDLIVTEFFNRYCGTFNCGTEPL
jgi:flagellar biosynthesis/type III secretory pathway chaperone